MTTPERKSSRKNYANWAAKLADWVAECGGTDEALTELAGWLAAGNSMDQLCSETGMNWGVLTAWVRSDEKRNARFMQAIEDRKAQRKEKLLDQWWKVADKESEDPLTHHDIHRARESLAKAEGVFSSGVNVSGDAKITIIHQSE